MSVHARVTALLAAVLASAAAFTFGYHDLRGCVGSLALGAVVWLSARSLARRRALRRSWRHDPVMVNPRDWDPR